MGKDTNKLDTRLSLLNKYRNSTRDFLAPGAPLFIIGSLVFLFFLVSRWFELPDPVTLAVIVGKWMATYGFWVVFLAYAVEGLFVVNFYWPGSFVLFVAVFGVESSAQLADIWIILNVAALVALSVDYLIGKFGMERFLLRFWSIDLYKKFSETMKRCGIWGVVLVGFHINWLALLVTFWASTKESSYSKIMAISMMSHAVWSAILVTLLSVFAESMKANLNSDGYRLNLFVIASFFALGTTLCFWKRIMERPKTR
jgi:membrane protein DedA with SNARE-associated domain